MPMLAIEICSVDEKGSKELAQVAVLEFLRLHGVDLDRGLDALLTCRRGSAASTLFLEVLGEVETEEEACAFCMRFPLGGRKEPCPLGSGRSRPLP